MTAYHPPAGPELRALLRRWGLTGRAAAAHLALRGGGRTVRKWTANPTHGTPCPPRIPYAALHLLAWRMDGVEIAPDTWRETLMTEETTP